MPGSDFGHSECMSLRFGLRLAEAIDAIEKITDPGVAEAPILNQPIDCRDP